MGPAFMGLLVRLHKYTWLLFDMGHFHQDSRTCPSAFSCLGMLYQALQLPVAGAHPHHPKHPSGIVHTDPHISENEMGISHYTQDNDPSDSLNTISRGFAD